MSINYEYLATQRSELRATLSILHAQRCNDLAKLSSLIDLDAMLEHLINEEDLTITSNTDKDKFAINVRGDGNEAHPILKWIAHLENAANREVLLIETTAKFEIQLSDIEMAAFRANEKTLSTRLCGIYDVISVDIWRGNAILLHADTTNNDFVNSIIPIIKETINIYLSDKLTID
jgi:hypothetical protein